jgi:type IV pilus assembly protein PilY1
LSGKSSRTAIVYAAANDGMVHAFQASDGVEKFAYVPNAVWPKLGLLLDPAYQHEYFVDGAPTAWDAYIGGAWKTVLTGSLGAGGKAVYALDVSNPDSFDAAKVLWEYQGNNATEQDNLGFVLGSVTIARFPDGHFWAVFGNGYESTNGNSVLFMVRVDSPSTVKMIDVGSGPNSGLSTPILVDSNGDRVVDLVYAGDLKGNLWKFDTSSASSAAWASAYGANPLFQAKDGLGNPQPIMSTPEVGLPPIGATGLAVYFGTGKYFEDGDNTTIGIQSMYGIIDSDGNSGTATGNFTGASHRSALVQQGIIFETTINDNQVRVLSNNTVDYSTDKGWVIDLLAPPLPGTAEGERVITGAALFEGKLLFQTITPSLSPCDFGGGSFFMQVDPATGGGLPVGGFDVDGDGAFDADDMVDIGGGVMMNVSGIDTDTGISGGFGAPIKAADKAYVPIGGTSGKIGAPPISSGSLKPRATWRQIQ